MRTSEVEGGATGGSHDEEESEPARISFFSYVAAELTTGYLLESQDTMYLLKEARVHTFMNIPKELEKLLYFGVMVCLDSFLFIFTFLPLRSFLAFFSMCMRKVTKTQICDMLRLSIFLVCSFALCQIDTSRMYHSIRGQSVLKLYVIFNVLEIFDKLCCAFGQDILDTLFWNAARERTSASAPADVPGRVRKRERLSVAWHLIIACIYVFIHSIIILNQVLTLNVAVNSHNSALLTLVVSTQFVELKGSVFKRFEVNNLFQMSCADMVERFNLVR